MKNHKTLGILIALTGALFLALMSYLVSIIQDTVPNSLIIAYRFLIGLIMLSPFTLLKKGFCFKAKKIHLIFVRACSGFIAMLLFFYALSYLPLANSMLLMNTSPLFTPIIVYFLTGVKTNRYVIFSIVVSFLGFLVIIQPESLNYNLVGYILGLFSGFFAALATVLLRIVGKDNKPEQMMFYFFLFTGLISLGVGLFSIKELSRYQFFIILLISFTGVIYQFSLTYALKLIQVRIVTPIMLSSVVFAGLLDLILNGVYIQTTFLFGSIIMVLGILGVIRFNT
jgi:drug/metabolite transporter (DMT)-like permease